ncbi:MAG: hypothetical protein RL386_585 [Bacteroidota bacterium]|jgi:hypothetical protein
MKRHLIRVVLTLSLLGKGGLFAQMVPQGIHHQGILLGEDGSPMTNSKVVLRIAMVSEVDGPTEYFSESHKVRTDDQGAFSLVIGEGRRLTGALSEVPFAEKQILLSMELESKRPGQFIAVNRSRLLSVPYALHANTAGRLESPPLADEEKNQSIYWLTGGNSLSAPPMHFLGTRDNKDFVLKTNNTTRIVVSKEGQFRLFSGVTGVDGSAASYPVTIEGSKQGIHIQVNEPRTGDNNFMTFGDDRQFSWGRIEGQTFSELEEDWEYQMTVTGFALAGASLALRIAAWTAKAIGEGASLFAAGAAAGTGGGIAAFVAEAAGLLSESITWGVKIREEIGVTYASGAGDYAEWLPRKAGERDLSFGEIVGVYGGQVSLNTEDNPGHFLVVSRQPILLGNTPQPADRGGFEKIAFMGQVQVKVAGPVSTGDYILPSGNNDGLGIAVRPVDMKAGDYARVVGVAWESGSGDTPFNFINTAVGINTNDLSKKVDKLNRRVENILAFLEGKAPLLDDAQLQAGAAPALSKPSTKALKVYSDEEIDQLLDRYEPFIKGIYREAEKELRKQGHDPDANPFLRAFLDNPVPAIKALRRDPSYFTQWAMFDQQLPQKK